MTPRSTSARGVFPFPVDRCLPPQKPYRSLSLNTYNFSLLVHIPWKVMTLITSLVTQAKMLSVPLDPTYSFTPSLGSQALCFLSPTYFPNLSSLLYPTVRDCQVHRCSSSCLQRALKTSIPPGNPPLLPCPHLLSPTQRSVAAAVDSSPILLDLPISNSWASIWGCSLATEACSALVWDRPQYQELNVPRTTLNQWRAGIGGQRSQFPHCCKG